MSEVQKKRHAYLIMAYTNPAQVCALLKQIDDPRNDIFLHYDKKFKAPVELFYSSVEYSKLVVIPDPIEVYWGDYSQVQCELLLLQTATEQHAYEYYHLLSGMDLLLKSQDYIHDFFERNTGKEFISIGKVELAEKLKYRYKYYFPNLNRIKNLRSKKMKALLVVWMCLQKIVGIDRTRNIKEDIRYGWQWFSITDKCARYVLTQKAWIERVFRNTFCCDEFFLQSVVCNAEVPFEIYGDPDDTPNRRYTDWIRGKPYTFRAEDFEELMNCPYIFARKFDQRVDAEIIKLITGYDLENINSK